jgi:hypothetical protein
MPDWLTHVLFAWALWNILSLSVFHTPVGALITSGIISMALFRDRIKEAHIFIALGTGSLFHLLLDLMVKSMDGRVMLFFPFSFESYSFNIFAQEDFIFLYIAIVVVLMSFGIRRYRTLFRK